MAFRTIEMLLVLVSSMVASLACFRKQAPNMVSSKRRKGNKALSLINTPMFLSIPF